MPRLVHELATTDCNWISLKVIHNVSLTDSNNDDQYGEALEEDSNHL